MLPKGLPHLVIKHAFLRSLLLLNIIGLLNNPTLPLATALCRRWKQEPKEAQRLHFSLMYWSGGLNQRNIPRIEWSLGNQYCCLYTHHNMMPIYSHLSMVQKIGLLAHKTRICFVCQSPVQIGLVLNIHTFFLVFKRYVILTGSTVV